MNWNIACLLVALFLPYLKRKFIKAMRITDIPEFDFLIFENRNRDYGAYYLRTKYKNAVIGGILLSVLFALAGVVLPFVMNRGDDKIISGGRGYYEVRMESLEPPPEQIYIPPAPPPPRETRAQEIAKYVPPVVVDSIIVREPPPMTFDDALTGVDEDLPEITGAGPGDNLLGEGDGFGNEEPYFFVEVMPSFRGGDLNNFRNWINKRTSYPQEAVDAKITGTVFLTFIVEKDGSVSNVTVLKGVHPLLDEAAAKAISESPKWSPGLQRGQPVRVRFQIPLTFMF